MHKKKQANNCLIRDKRILLQSIIMWSHFPDRIYNGLENLAETIINPAAMLLEKL
jgi:hypothetical protein